MTAPLDRPLGLGTTRHELAMARHFLTPITANGQMQMDCAVDSINKAVDALPDLGYYDSLSDTQKIAVGFLIDHMATTKQDASQCLSKELFGQLMVQVCKMKRGEA